MFKVPQLRITIRPTNNALPCIVRFWPLSTKVPTSKLEPPMAVSVVLPLSRTVCVGATPPGKKDSNVGGVVDGGGLRATAMPVPLITPLPDEFRP